MKRLLLGLVALVVLAGFTATPANATQVRGNCNTYTSPNGDKKIQICVYIAYDGNGIHYWGKDALDNVPNFGLPYALSTIQSQGVVVWSADNNGGPNYCEGDYGPPSCSGSGNANWLLVQPVNSATPYTYTTDHYLPANDLKCWIHVETQPSIYWTQNQYNNNQFDTHDFNTTNGDLNVNTGPGSCIGA